MKYVRDLARSDDKVMSVSPQVGKESRPFVGTVVICNQKKYCVPLTSPKPKHQTMKNDRDFSRYEKDMKKDTKKNIFLLTGISCCDNISSVKKVEYPLSPGTSE